MRSSVGGKAARPQLRKMTHVISRTRESAVLCGQLYSELQHEIIANEVRRSALKHIAPVSYSWLLAVMYAEAACDGSMYVNVVLCCRFFGRAGRKGAALCPT